jgi:NADH-quinone oxidoreductase subunit K
MTFGLQHVLSLAAILFALGLYCVATRRNAIMLLMGIELVLNAANINFVAFARFDPNGAGRALNGEAASIFVMLLAACEAAVAVAIIPNVYRRCRTVNVDEVDMLRD